MSENTNTQPEPMGIIISRGSRSEPAPKFWAYVWAPAPEAEVIRSEPKAA